MYIKAISLCGNSVTVMIQGTFIDVNMYKEDGSKNNVSEEIINRGYNLTTLDQQYLNGTVENWRNGKSLY